MLYKTNTRPTFTHDQGSGNAENESGAPENASTGKAAAESESLRDPHAAGSGAGAEAAPSDVSALQAELASTTAKLAETQDRLLRMAADFDNTRKRWERERGEVRTYSISEFARDLLPVIDSFDKAMNAIEQAQINFETEDGKRVSSIVEGVQLVSKVFSDALKKHGIERLPGKGEVFNPSYHNAVAKTVDPSLKQDTVVDEFVAGYKIGDRVLRTAMVRVASPD